ncbi:PD-(D/E)XK nuclease family protein [Aurantiacibacter gangjinensis]|uniref:Helicase n=1 Tax=Aurantiacibacter gangjinensis TaxID=502682 RepID=A0A0G9MQN3_9SPHN|nr:PD-(D/E)XK nuclease family protein [Aurantiacibacter gangjinensis]APE28916.1 ATP-dependent nuclease subunit B [Aurantiacibacter gangjinensis]KLE33042.1 helicase [Aurantiacibacter gangjinensis]
MSEHAAPNIYSIAAHRGFADALVAGLVPRYAEGDFGLARLTLLLPSARAARTISEAFVRHAGETGSHGLLMPRMVLVGDLDLDEALGPLFDSLGAGAAIPPAADPTRRWVRLAALIRQVKGDDAPKGAALLNLARETGQVMDRLLVEEIAPEDLLSDAVLDLVGDLSDHWRENLHLFATLQRLWLAELQEAGQLDASARRNLLFTEAAKRMRDNPPETPFVAAGVTSAAPALARLLKTVSQLPKGAVVLPDLDLSMSDVVWDELGSAGDTSGETPFARGDAVTHPQYHLKLLLNRMGVARAEVQPWHRAGIGKGPPARSHAISSLFLPPESSKAWVDLPAAKRRLAGVRLIEAANPEEEAQSVALLVREALETPEKRVAVVTPDRGLAGRVAQHLRRWIIQADDSAGQPLGETAAGRVLLLLAEVAAEKAAPVPLMALLQHPLAKAGDERNAWLRSARKFELRLRGPRKEAGLSPLRPLAAKAGVGEWWQEVEAILSPLLDMPAEGDLATWLDGLAATAEALCGENIWAREDGRALSNFVENLRLNARDVTTPLAAEDLPRVLRDAMDTVAVRPPYGGHPRVAIYGLLEARMTRADLVICAGLNEGTWPPRPSTDPLLSPGVLRALGVPGADFRIGLSAHDLAGMLGAPEVVLSRARRDLAGPAIASRFLLRVRALLGQKMTEDATDEATVDLARRLDDPPPVDPAKQPKPCPPAEMRRRDISVTGLDRLRSDPYQYYASKLLSLRDLDLLDAEPTPAWQGELAHAILEDWHNGEGELAELAEKHMRAMSAHPLMRALWRPRLLAALEWVSAKIAEDADRKPEAIEQWGEMTHRGIRIFGKADRIDRLADGSLAVVDYKTGRPPSGAEVEAGYALQLGTIGLIANAGGFENLTGEPTRFEYWSLGRDAKSETGFGYVSTPVLEGRKRSGIPPEEFLPQAQAYLDDALSRWILGDEPFTARLNPDAPGYDTYDQLMRLAEWQGREEREA